MNKKMIDAHRVVGLYGDPAAVVADPAYLDAAQGEIGLNRIIFGGTFNLTSAVRVMNPYPEGQDPRAPGLILGDDDSTLRRAIDEAHQRDIGVWGILSTYWAGAEYAPDLMARDLAGRRMDEFPRLPYAHEQATHTFCPNNERVNAWFEAVLVDIATRYDLQGYALTHFRFCHPAFFQQMLACGCPYCAQAATEMGYDFSRMKAAVLEAVAALQRLPARTLHQAASLGLGFVDFLQTLGHDGGGVVDWFNFRADVISRNLKRFREAVHRAVGPDFAFGTDVHVPTFALLVGHRYRDLAEMSDQILPLLRHIAIHYLDNLASFASLLVQWADGLSESDALRLVYRLFGYDHFALPTDIPSLHLDDPYGAAEQNLEALGDIVADELYKARLYSGDMVRSYPVIAGTSWPAATIRRLMAVAEDAGHDGIVFQGTSALFRYPKGGGSIA
jgi:hypothetical protein